MKWTAAMLSISDSKEKRLHKEKKKERENVISWEKNELKPQENIKNIDLEDY